MNWWLGIRSFQTVLYRNTHTGSCKIPFKIISTYYILFFYFLQLKKIKSNSLVAVYYALRPSQLPTALLSHWIIANLFIKHWTIRLRDDHNVVPLSQRIVLKIIGFLVKAWMELGSSLVRFCADFVHSCQIWSTKKSVNQVL